MIYRLLEWMTQRLLVLIFAFLYYVLFPLMFLTILGGVILVFLTLLGLVFCQ
jgi:hypothetical protein